MAVMSGLAVLYAMLLRRYYYYCYYSSCCCCCCCCCRRRQLSFKVTYRQSGKDSVMAVSLAVMSSLAVLYAMLLTWSWYRRSGRLTVDLVVMFKFLLFALGTVADAIFLVVFGASLYYLLLYKVRRGVYKAPEMN